MNYIELTIATGDTDAAALLMAEMAEAGFESFVENEQGFTAYIPERDFTPAMLDMLRFFHPESMQVSQALIPEQNWNATWEENFDAVEVDDFCCIRAPFHAPAQGKKYEIVIEPKMSFGTGHHETTSSMIRLMADLDFKGKTVLDMGCGTSVLAILAVMMGAGETHAIDNDEWAYRNSLENVQRNKADQILVALGDAKSLAAFPEGHFDIILANINRNILLADIPSYARVLQPGGRLLLSGFYEEDRPMVLEKCTQFSLREVRFLSLNHWIALETQKF